MQEESEWRNVVEVRELETALKVALMVASTDKTRPHINCVHFETDMDELRVVATDGHRVVSVTMQIRDGCDWEATLYLQEMKRLYANLKTLPKDERDGRMPLVPALDIDAGRHVKHGDVEFGRLGVFRGIDQEALPFPPWRKVVPPMLAEGKTLKTGAYGISATYLKGAADIFIALHGNDAAMRWSPPKSPTGPLRFDTASSSYPIQGLYVVMPMRIDGNDW